MKLGNGLKTFLTAAIKGDSYWVEKAKLDFALGLENRRRSAELTYAAIAQKIGTSGAYITKVFRGDSNLTIESMVKLARATGGELEIRIAEKCDDAFIWDAVKLPAQVQNRNASMSTTAIVVSMADYAANNASYQHYKMAA
jgi:transcriptional regulator with XRE-family HTH domain